MVAWRGPAFSLLLMSMAVVGGLPADAQVPMDPEACATFPDTTFDALPIPDCRDARWLAGTHPVVLETLTLTADAAATNPEMKFARGFVAYPTDIEPTTLLVVAHGCCRGTAHYDLDDARPSFEPWAKLGAVVVGMEYRGDGGWNVWTGHIDTILATEHALDRWPTLERTILYGGSMGGEVSGMALAARPDLYDYWIDAFGVTNLAEQMAFYGFRPIMKGPSDDPANPFGGWILKETGGWPGAEGVPGTVPAEEWIVRSPALRAHEMKGGSLKHAYICHGVGDLVVPVTQSIEMHAALTWAGIPATLFLTVSGEPGKDPYSGARYSGTYVPLFPGWDGPVDPDDPAEDGTQSVFRRRSVVLIQEGWAGFAGHDYRGYAPCIGLMHQLIVSPSLPGVEDTDVQVRDQSLVKGTPLPTDAGAGLDIQPLEDLVADVRGLLP